jgi:hypothetical protein
MTIIMTTLLLSAINTAIAQNHRGLVNRG